MVNLRYFISILHSALEESTSKVVKVCMFLTKTDISFFKANNCLISIHSTDVKDKYNVEFDREQLLAFCNQ